MPLSLDLSDEGSRPYFLWDTVLTVRDLKALLRSPDTNVKIYWMARVLRDARYSDVWQLVNLREVLTHWEVLRTRLGREQARWEFLIDGWRSDGLIE